MNKCICNVNTGLKLVSRDVLACIIYGLEKRNLFVRPIMNLPPPCGENLLSRVTVRKGVYGVKYKGINCGWAWNNNCTQVARNSGPISLILLWGHFKITFSGRWSGPSENIVLGRSQPLSSQPLLHVMTRLKPASSINMNVFFRFQLYHPLKRHLL